MSSMSISAKYPALGNMGTKREREDTRKHVVQSVSQCSSLCSPYVLTGLCRDPCSLRLQTRLFTEPFTLQIQLYSCFDFWRIHYVLKMKLCLTFTDKMFSWIQHMIRNWIVAHDNVIDVDCEKMAKKCVDFWFIDLLIDWSVGHLENKVVTRWGPATSEGRFWKNCR